MNKRFRPVSMMLLSAGLLAGGCKKDPPAADTGSSRASPVKVTDASTAPVAVGLDASVPSVAGPRPSPPETMFYQLSGANLRRLLPLFFPEARGQEGAALEAIAPRITPGANGLGNKIDLDFPFVGLVTLNTTAAQPRQDIFVAWPLKPGSAIAQNARNKLGWRDEGDGMFSPTAPDAGAGQDNLCWVGQREPVGWMLLCGPNAGLAQVASYLKDQVNHPAEGNPIVQVALKPATFKRISQLQLAQIESQPVPQGTSPMESAQRAMLAQMRKDLKLRGTVVNDAEIANLSLTQDENNMHLRAEMNIRHISQDETRELLKAATSHIDVNTMVSMLPATVQGFFVETFESGGIEKVFGLPEADISVTMQVGSEVAEVVAMINSVTNMTPLGTRITAYSPEDGGTMYHIVQNANAAKFVSDLRLKLNSIPPKPIQPGTILTLRDIFALLPVSLDRPDAIRIGRRLPPGTPIPEDQRPLYERSMLILAEGDKIIAVRGKDPVARYRAMSVGDRLKYTMPANSPFAGRITPETFFPMFFPEVGNGTEQLSSEPLDISLDVTPDGEGAKVTVKADASIVSAMGIRMLYAYIEQLQQKMLEQQQQQQQGAGGGHPSAPAQGGNPAGGGGNPTGGGGAATAPGPSAPPAPSAPEPSAGTPLPDPPSFQLRAPH